MKSTSLIESLRPLQRPRGVRLAVQLAQFERICTADQSLHEFSSHLLDWLRLIFGAQASALWLRSDADAGSARVHMRSGGWIIRDGDACDNPNQNADALVLAHWHQQAPISEYLTGSGCLVLVAPLRDKAGALGALQLLLSVPPSEFAENAQRQPVAAAPYLLALTRLANRVQTAVSRHVSTRTLPLELATGALQPLKLQIAGVQRALRLAIEQYFQQFSQSSFGSLAANQEFTRLAQQLLDAHALRFRCPECGHPAILRCAKNSAVPSGVFVFDHYLPEGRTFHGGTRHLPLLKLTSKPARKKGASSVD
jgi:hypothetical protein